MRSISIKARKGRSLGVVNKSVNLAQTKQK